LSEVEPIHLKKKISELRNDDVKPFEGNALEGAKNKKDGFIRGPRMV
jgi:Asp-tRNA(Asn)/Glu-tRNA(Gln) amidotransferase C subunit